jgi:hypothetical protein
MSFSQLAREEHVAPLPDGLARGVLLAGVDIGARGVIVPLDLAVIGVAVNRDEVTLRALWASLFEEERRDEARTRVARARDREEGQEAVVVAVIPGFDPEEGPEEVVPCSRQLSMEVVETLVEIERSANEELFRRWEGAVADEGRTWIR